MNKFVQTQLGSTEVFEISSFNKTGLVTHGITTRLGGTGSEPYDALNLAFHVGDCEQTVLDNRKVICRELGCAPNDLVTAKQVHGTNIEVVDRNHAGLGALSYQTALPDTDGLITASSGVMLATFYADCVPILILDPAKRVIANVHAGWKGTAARIGALTVRKMTDVFGTDPKDCLVGIGPSIGPCCFEVAEPVIQIFQNEFDWWSEVTEFIGDGKARLNLWAANRQILINEGIPAGNVEIAQICTKCRQDILFSHRGSGGITGRMGAFIMLMPD